MTQISYNMFGQPEQPKPFNYLDSLQAFNAQSGLDLNNSPVTDGVSMPRTPVSGMGTLNPYGYVSWDQAGGLGNWLGGNAKLFGAGMDFLSKGIGAYTGLKTLGLAQDAFKQEKKAFNINLANQTQSYNTAVGDRIAGRSYSSEAERQAALSAAQLTDRSSYAKKDEDKKGG
jgi:hypothetical protein